MKKPKIPTKKPERSTISIALKSGKVVTIKNCLVQFAWNASAKDFVVVLPFETQKKIDAVYQKS